MCLCVFVDVVVVALCCDGNASLARAHLESMAANRRASRDDGMKLDEVSAAAYASCTAS